MLQSVLLRDHADALKRLSGISREPAVAAKLQEMADEVRIMISVAEIRDLAASGLPPLRALAPTPSAKAPSRRRRSKRSRRTGQTSKSEEHPI
jgi:hypothetical protein